jgi:hypothetical protein
MLLYTWSLALRKEHKLWVFEIGVLRRIFWPKRDAIIGGWRKLHSEDLHNLYSLSNMIRMIKSRIMRWAGHMALMGMKRNECIQDFGGKARYKETIKKT